MPICVFCKKPLHCPSCSKPQPIGQTVLGCPQRIPGKLWIHVIDDLGNNIANVPTVGPFAKVTDGSGLAMFEGLDEGKQKVQLGLPLTGAVAELYDAPAHEEHRHKVARIEDGTLAHVPFVLTRKSRLTVSFFDVSNNGKVPFSAASIPAKARYLGGPGTAPAKNPVPSTDGVANFGTVSSGDYDIEPDYRSLDAALWGFESGSRKVTLAPGMTGSVEFELVRKANVDVQVLFKRKLSSDPEVRFTQADVAVKAVFHGPSKQEVTVRTGTTGLASFRSLMPGKYTFEPDYGAVDRAVYEVDDGSRDADLASGDNKALRFEVVRQMPRLRVKVILKANPVKRGPEVVFQDTEVPLSIKLDPGSEVAFTTGQHDFGAQKPGKYKLTLSFAQPGQNRYDLLDPTDADAHPWQKEVDLDDKDAELVFQVEPLYQKVQFIGHCLATVARFIWTGTSVADTYAGLKAENVKDPMEKAEREHSKDLWKAAYNGDSDEEVDINRRLEIVRAALALAAQNVDDKDDELKVYAMPECFFLGKYGAYQVKNIPTLMEKLQELVAGPEWRHWVFVFGTVNGHYAPGSKELGDIPEFFNLSPVVRGGCGAKGERIKLIQKAYYSAEIMESGELEDLAVYGGKEVTSDKVGGQFSATENEAVLGMLVEDLLPVDRLDEPLVGAVAIDTKVADWVNVRAKVGAYIKTKGMTHLVRDIRGLATGESLSPHPRKCTCSKP